MLAEVFHARPGEVEEMIQRKLEESGQEEREDEGFIPISSYLALAVKYKLVDSACSVLHAKRSR